MTKFKVLTEGYPFVYERAIAGRKYLIALNPSAEEKQYDISDVGNIVVSHNVRVGENTLYMGGISCLVAEMV